MKDARGGDQRENIRAALLRARDAVPAELRREKSILIGDRLLGLEEFGRSRTVMFYVSVGGEVETRGLIEKSLRLNKRVAVPWCDRQRGSLVAAEIEDYDRDLEVGCHGIPAPPESRLSPVPPAEIDLVVVPGVGFDCRGGRLGWGKGYYDRFLEGAPAARKIGLALEAQMAPFIELCPHDVPMDRVITEERVIDCCAVRSRMK